jgi:NAD(P)H-dependent FMN reductase
MAVKLRFLLGSARRESNTEALARAAALALPDTSEQQWLRLPELPLPPFEDLRHTVGVYPQPMGHEKTLFEATLWADNLVFASINL